MAISCFVIISVIHVLAFAWLTGSYMNSEWMDLKTYLQILLALVVHMLSTFYVCGYSIMKKKEPLRDSQAAGPVETLNLTDPEGFMDISFGDSTTKIFFRQSIPNPEETYDAVTDVLFLHGAAFSSKIWDDEGTLDLVASVGMWALAIDLPGFGQSPKADIGSESEYISFVESVITTFGLNKVVIVFPSMSGRYAIPTLLKSNEINARSGEEFQIVGMVSVAPVIDAQYTSDPKSTFGSVVDMPLLVTCGELDKEGQPTTDILKHVPGSRVEMIANAKHAAYLSDGKEQWQDVFFDFVSKI